MPTKPPPVSELVDTTTTVSPTELQTYYRNARRGDIPAIARSIKKLGMYKPITVNVGTHTGRPNEVLAGNHTLMAIRQLADQYPDEPKWQTIKVHWGDWDEDDCRLINIADNRTAELGGYDNEALAGLVNDIPEIDLAAVGYSPSDIADLNALISDAADVDERGTGEKLALWGATVGEPDIAPEVGSIWNVGHHVLAVVSLHKDWPVWSQLLSAGMIFAPYPSLMLPYTDVARTTPLLMVMPDPYIAGWLITKWNRLFPDQAAVQR